MYGSAADETWVKRRTCAAGGRGGHEQGSRVWGRAVAGSTLRAGGGQHAEGWLAGGRAGSGQRAAGSGQRAAGSRGGEARAESGLEWSRIIIFRSAGVATKRVYWCETGGGRRAVGGGQRAAAGKREPRVCRHHDQMGILLRRAGAQGRGRERGARICKVPRALAVAWAHKRQPNKAADISKLVDNSSEADILLAPEFENGCLSKTRWRVGNEESEYYVGKGRHDDTDDMRLVLERPRLCLRGCDPGRNKLGGLIYSISNDSTPALCAAAASMAAPEERLKRDFALLTRCSCPQSKRFRIGKNVGDTLIFMVIRVTVIQEPALAKQWQCHAGVWPGRSDGRHCVRGGAFHWADRLSGPFANAVRVDPEHLEGYQLIIKVIGHYAYIGSEALGHGIQVFDSLKLLDKSLLDHPKEFSIETDLTALYDELPHWQPEGSSHNVVSHADKNLIVAVGALPRLEHFRSKCAAGLIFIDVTDPANPTTAGCAGDDGYVHDAQCLTYYGPDAKYNGFDVCYSFNEDTFTIYNITDPSRHVLSSASSDQPSYGYVRPRTLPQDVVDVNSSGPQLIHAGCATHQVDAVPPIRVMGREFMMGKRMGKPLQAAFDGRNRAHKLYIARNGVALQWCKLNARPSVISATFYHGVSYSHQGWVTDVKNQSYLLLNDDSELDEVFQRSWATDQETTTYIWDIRDLARPVLTGKHKSPVVAINHNLYVHNSLAYESNYRSGLRIVDVCSVAADPTGGSFVKAAFFDAIVPDSPTGVFPKRTAHHFRLKRLAHHPDGRNSINLVGVYMDEQGWKTGWRRLGTDKTKCDFWIYMYPKLARMTLTSRGWVACVVPEGLMQRAVLRSARRWD
ncbi:hypothetical protein GGX14DRAFT_673735 [Mycena pura]|uniref:Uncharacterized protein n=1 Tax=Mycena pura TaxID=153505 RepID=A0AAD6UZZ8_9AGAR|nr:hypothetical protein GGX14DRAFT_673735 [Mycena pura]